MVLTRGVSSPTLLALLPVTSVLLLQYLTDAQSTCTSNNEWLCCGGTKTFNCASGKFAHAVSALSRYPSQKVADVHCASCKQPIFVVFLLCISRKQKHNLSFTETCSFSVLGYRNIHLRLKTLVSRQYSTCSVSRLPLCCACFSLTYMLHDDTNP